MRIGFVGTSSFAAQILSHLIDNNNCPQWVLTRPDSLAGRGKKLNPSTVKQLAIKQQLKLYQPEKIDSSFVKQLGQTEQNAPDVVVVVAYGQILPQEFLSMPNRGCVNIHPSLLPRWRGAAPIERSIEAGDRETGISIFKLVPQLDAGPVIIQKRCPLAPEDTAASLSEKLNQLACEAISEYLKEPNNFTLMEQQERDVTYAKKLNKEEAQINWHDEAVQIVRKINAFNPHPGAYSWLGNERVKLLQARIKMAKDLDDVSKQQESPGSFSRNHRGEIMVSCDRGSKIKIQQLQFAGKSVIEPSKIQGNSPLDKHQAFSHK